MRGMHLLLLLVGAFIEGVMFTLKWALIGSIVGIALLWWLR